MMGVNVPSFSMGDANEACLALDINAAMGSPLMLDIHLNPPMDHSESVSTSNEFNGSNLMEDVSPSAAYPPFTQLLHRYFR